MSIIPKNEDRGDEMVENLNFNHPYVPMVECTEKVQVPSHNEQVEVHKARSFPILLHGDFLTAARARGAQKAKVNSASPTGRLEGLVPLSSDWHTKLKALSLNYS